MAFRLKLGGFLFISLSGMLVQLAAFAVTCPTGYGDVSGVCMPSLPNAEFVNDATNYPICGPGRVALSGDGDYSWSTFSSSGKPRSSAPAYSYTYAGNTQDYFYTSSTNPNPPAYAYPPNSRCYCLGKRLSTSLSEATNLSPIYSLFPATLGSGALRQYPVSFDVVSTQNAAGTVKYGPVAIAKDPTQDGRVNALIAGEAAASCGCPNVNEEPLANGADANPVGTYCSSMVDGTAVASAGQSVRVLAAFDPILHSAQVMSSAWEETDMSGTIATRIRLPTSGSDQNSLSDYDRKIWTCAAPYELNTGTKACAFNSAHHMCDNGAGGGPPSPVSELVSGYTGTTASYATQFDNTVNRKLACCMNSFHTNAGATDPYEKFDCIDNSASGLYNSFDDLWSTGDAAADGGQINAIILSDSTKLVGTNRVPHVISGFYSLNGQHCDQFSEFAYASGSSIKHYRVAPAQKAGQQTYVAGAPVTFGTDIPVSSAGAYAQINTKVTTTLGKSVPTTADDMRSCPILVRAAIVTTCPSATTIPNVLASVNASASGRARCAAAAGVQVHIRLEQIFEILGQAPLKPIDSYADLNQTTSIDVSNLILEKTGNMCPPSTTPKGGRCIY